MLAASACGGQAVIQHPEGFKTTIAEGERVRLRSAGVGRFTWKTWEVHDGRQIDTELLAYSRKRSLRNFDFDVAFALHLDPDGTTQSASCSTNPGDADDAVRLDCRMKHPDGESHYRMAEHTPVCTEWILSQVYDRQLRECWLGQLVTPIDTYHVEFAFLEDWHAPVPRLVWRDSSGAVVQASRWEDPLPFEPDAIPTIGPPAIEPVQPNGEWIRNLITLHRVGAPEDDHDRLMLNAVALHVWFRMLVTAQERSLDREYGDWSTVG